MKKLNYILVAMVTALLLPMLAAAAPLLINYQGRLVDTAGNPLAGAQSIRFSIHDAATAGSELWNETQGVTPDNGIFSVALGGVTPLPASVFASDSRYLEVKIGADPAMTPRTRLLSTPYALYTANLGSSGTSALISTDTVMSNSQLRLGNFANLPGGMGEGAIVYDSVSKQINFWNGTAWTALAAGGVSPWSSAADKVILVDGQKNVGVGTGTPLYKLHVSSAAGEAGEILVVSTGTSDIFRVNGAGEVRANKYYGDGSALTGIVTTDKVLKTGDTMTGTLVMDAASAFNTTLQPAIVFSTNVIVNGQIKVGAYVSEPNAAALGAGALYYKDGDTLYVSNGVSWTQLAAGGASPWTAGGGAVTLLAASNLVGVGKAPVEKLDVAGTINSDFGVKAATMVVTNTGAFALDVAGGINAGTGNVGIVAADGRIPGLSSTFFASVSAANLTDIPSSQLSGGVPTDLVDLSTVTTALNGKISAGATIALSQVTGVAASTDTVGGERILNFFSSTNTVPGTHVDLSTVTTALSGKLSNSAGISSLLVDLSTVTTALNGKMATGATIALSQVTGVAASTDTVGGARIVNFFSSTNTVPGTHVDLSTVTTALNGKMATGAAIALSQITGVAASTDTVGGARIVNFFSSTNTVPGTHVDLSTVTTALNGKMATGAAIALSQITGVAASTDTVGGARIVNFFSSTNTVPGTHVDLSTVTTALNGKMAAGAAIALSQITGVAASTDTIGGERILNFFSSTNTVPGTNVDFSTVAALGANTFTGKQTVTALEGVGVTFGVTAATITLSGGIHASSATLTGDAEVRGGLTVSSGTKVNNIIHGTVNVDPVNVVTQTCGNTAVAVAAAAAGDKVMWTAPAAIEAGIMWSSYDAGVGNLGLRICNATAGDVNPAAADWGYLIVR